MRSKAAVEFTAKFTGDVVKLGELFRVSASTISSWRSGDRVPRPEKRELIRRAGGPAAGDWDVAATEEPATEPAEVPLEPATPEATFREADQLLQYVRQLRDGVMREPALTVAERLKLCGQVAEMITQLGKLTGVALSNERQIVSSPPFANVVGIVVKALEPWPDAMRSVADALRSLDGGA